MTMIVITSDRHRRGARSRRRTPDESKRRFQSGSKNWQKSSMSQKRGRMSIERASLSQGWVFWRTPSYEIWLSLHILIPYSRYFSCPIRVYSGIFTGMDSPEAIALSQEVSHEALRL